MGSAQVRESRRANSWNRMILIIRVSPPILVHSTVQTDSGSSGTRSERLLRITPTRCRRSCYCRHPSSRHLGATATPGTTTKTLDPLHLDTPIPVVTCTMSPYTAQPNRGHEDIAGLSDDGSFFVRHIWMLRIKSTPHIYLSALLLCRPRQGSTNDIFAHFRAWCLWNVWRWPIGSGCVCGLEDTQAVHSGAFSAHGQVTAYCNSLGRWDHSSV